MWQSLEVFWVVLTGTFSESRLEMLLTRYKAQDSLPPPSPTPSKDGPAPNIGCVPPWKQHAGLEVNEAHEAGEQEDV